jgi:hypothetical protein
LADDYLDRLARFAATTPAAAIPADVRVRAAAILADCVACIVAGTAAPEVRALAAYWQDRISEPLATVAGLPDRLGREAAALVGARGRRRSGGGRHRMARVDEVAAVFPFGVWRACYSYFPAAATPSAASMSGISA